jgi:hypothetical protein
VTVAVRHVSPSGAGARDGLTRDDAGTLNDLPAFVSAVGPGGEVWIHGSLGPYRQDFPLTITSGGAEANPVVIRGVDADGGSTVRATVTGSRAYPWGSGLPEGSDVFNLAAGADHLQFTNMDFANHRLVFTVSAAIRGLTLEDMRVDRVKQFVQTGATVSGLTIRRLQAFGYLKMVLLGADTNNVLIEDVLGDAEGQTNNFSMGVQFLDTVHGVTVRRAVMRNHRTSRTSTTAYWNGDGFSAEETAYDLVYEDTEATGNTDAGYDIKSATTQMIRPRAADNKQNYRVRYRGVTITDGVSENPLRRGGTGLQLHVKASIAPNVVPVQIVPAVMRGCRFVDNGPASADSTIFQAENLAVLNVEGGSVQYQPGGILESEVNGGVVNLAGVAINGSNAEIEPPTPPSTLSGTAARTSATLSWTPSTDDVGVAGYTVFRDGVSVGTTQSLTYKDVGLQRRTSYRYFVTAFDSSGNSSSPSPTLALRTR